MHELQEFDRRLFENMCGRSKPMCTFDAHKEIFCVLITNSLHIRFVKQSRRRERLANRLVLSRCVLFMEYSKTSYSLESVV